jgi:hypothetical protein
VTFSILRRGKDAKPTVSKVITRSNDIEIDSIIQTAKLKEDLRSD